MRKHRETYKFPPKDGGWGWFVILGAGMMSFLISGFIRTFSVIFQALRTKFNSSASATAWVVSINVTMAWFSGPISTMLSTRFSVRTVGMVGSLLMFLGFLASAYAPSLPYTYVAYGIAGIGQGFLHTPTLIIIAQWFDKKKARATSLGLMMDGFGTLVLAPLLQFLFDYYGYSGTMLIVAALMANTFVVAALYRAPDKLDYIDDVDVMQQFVENEAGNQHETEIEFREPANQKKTNSIRNLTDAELSEPLNQNVTNSIVKEPDGVVNSTVNNSTNQYCTDEKSVNGRLISKTTVIPEDNETKTHASNHEITNHVTDSVPNDGKSEGKSQTILKYFDYHLFKMGRYLTFSLLMACASLCISMCNTHIAGLALESKLSTPQISLLISAMGGMIIVARFFSGFLFDYSTVRKIRIHLFSAFGLIISVSLLLSLWIHNIIGFYILWLTYITAAGVFVTQESIVLADIVGRDRFSSAIGITRLFRGTGVLIGPTVGGFLKDYTGVYNYTFMFGGLVLLVAVMLFELSVIIEKHRRKSKT